jgi:UDP-N-acetylmuramoyl-L-alanyl-D-glutamate--2,6-diaminopimelate ligase
MEGQRGVTLTALEWRTLLGVAPPSVWPKTLSGLHPDSRRIRAGDLFVAIPGHQADGLNFLADALRRGAGAVIAARMPEPRPSVPVVVVADPRAVLARLSSALYGYPGRQLRITGITGTNGKTTVAVYVRQLLASAGRDCGVLGTVCYAFGQREIPSRRTTPGPPELQQLLRSMCDAGCSDCAMEISSHALDQQRVAGLEVNCAVFTNLSQDHLDYHHDMESYFAAKARLFEFPSLEHRVLGDDAWSRRLHAIHGGLRCGFDPDCEVRATDIRLHIDGTQARVHSPWGEGDLSLAATGAHNLRNALQALAVCGSYGLPFSDLLRAAATLRAAPGRLEPIPAPRGRIYVDYAHTPDAVANVLGALRPLVSGKLIVLLGCGGDRDRGKRPLMTAAAACADQLILSSDNPRSEDPAAILRDMLPGIPAGLAHEIIPDRATAIQRGVDLLETNDLFLIAGKGHETVQEIGAMQIPFDDRDVARKAAELRRQQLPEGR